MPQRLMLVAVRCARRDCEEKLVVENGQTITIPDGWVFLQGDRGRWLCPTHAAERTFYPPRGPSDAE